MVFSSGFSDGTVLDKKTGEPIPRSFDPAASDKHRELNLADLIFYDSEQKVSKFRVINPLNGMLEVDRSSLIIHVDGACRDNGRQVARSSWGVFFGPGSPYNKCGILPPNLPQTNSRAEIEAISQALDIIQKIVVDAKDYTLQKIYILSDSQYVVNALTAWWARWMENGGKTAAGQQVAHLEKLKEIQRRIGQIGEADGGMRQVKLWHIRRERNKEADALANRALDEVRVI